MNVFLNVFSRWVWHSPHSRAHAHHYGFWWSIVFKIFLMSLMFLSSPDQIALPDFHAGAMENWGLITYRETALLYDPVLSSTGNKERVATVISHELAHMVGHNIPAKLLSSHQFQRSGEKGKIALQSGHSCGANSISARLLHSYEECSNVVNINLAGVLNLPLQTFDDRQAPGDKLTLLAFRCI